MIVFVIFDLFATGDFAFIGDFSFGCGFFVCATFCSTCLTFSCILLPISLAPLLSTNPLFVEGPTVSSLPILIPRMPAPSLTWAKVHPSVPASPSPRSRRRLERTVRGRGRLRAASWPVGKEARRLASKGECRSRRGLWNWTFFPSCEMRQTSGTSFLQARATSCTISCFSSLPFSIL